MLKEIKIVTLEGNTIEEIEAKATEVVNEGGTVIGQGAVLIEGTPIPALVIIRRAPVVDPVVDYDDEDEDEDFGL